MHVCGVPGNFRVGFLVGPLDLDFLSLFNYGIMTILPAKYGQCPFFVTFQLRHNDDFACQIRPMPFFVTFQLRRNGGLQTQRKFEVQL